MNGLDEARGPDSAVRAGLTVLEVHDEDAWADVLAQSHQHDFHHLAGYHRVAEQRGEGKAFLFVYREASHLVALPLLIRPIDPDDPGGLHDATSVYGYAGPLSSHEHVPEEVVTSFQTAVREQLVDRRVVSVFSRLHPLIAQEHLITGLGEVIHIGMTVSVDLTLPLEDQWAGYSKKSRRIVRKAAEAGTVCVDDLEWAYRSEWVNIYRETMERVGAPSSYLFDEAYFDLLAAELGDVLHLFVALVDGNVASAGLYTVCDGIAQAHLGASRQEFARLSPTRLLDDTARRWAAAAGARVFHLGGGVGGREDSLFHYKAGFSDRRHPYGVWRWIVDPKAYEALCDHVAAGEAPASSEDYFPAYRRSVGVR